MARVYMARFDSRATGNSQVVALKMVHTENESHNAAQANTFFEALKNEVELLRRLKHPNIVKLYPIPGVAAKDPYMARASELPGQPWYCVMEYLAGGALHQTLQARGKLKIEDAVEIAYQVGLALDLIHSKEIAHLDVKPDNVLFRAGLDDEHPIEAVLIDFGVATRRFRRALDAGAMPYLAPERLRVVRGEIPPENVGDQRPVDVYSLGILLYRMLTETLPFRGQNRDHLTSAILYSTPTRPRQFNGEIPPPLEDLILAALEKDPRVRPSVSEFTERLDEAVPPPRTWIRSAPAAPLAPSRRTPGWLGLGGVAILAIVGLGVGFAAGTTLHLPLPVIEAPAPMATSTLIAPTKTIVNPTKADTPVEPTAVPTQAKTILAPTSTLVPTLVPTSTRARTRTPTVDPNLTLTPAATPTGGTQD